MNPPWHSAAVIGTALCLCGCHPGAGAKLSPLGPPPPSGAPVASAAKQAPQTEIGKRLLEQNLTEAALKAFQHALIEDGVSHDALIGVAVASHRLGRLGQARRILLEAVELYPGSATAWNNLGVVHHAAGDLASAEAAFLTAFQLASGQDESIARNLEMIAIAAERSPSGAVVAAETPWMVSPRVNGVYVLESVEERDGDA